MKYKTKNSVTSTYSGSKLIESDIKRENELSKRPGREPHHSQIHGIKFKTN